MINVLKAGKYCFPDRKVFTCEACGCEFSATFQSVTVVPQLHAGNKNAGWVTSCPECKVIARIPYKEAE